MKKQTTILIIGAAVIVALSLGGWAVVSNPQIATTLGLRHGPAQGGSDMSSTTPNRFHGTSEMRGGITMGSIEVLNDNGFTLSLSDGTTKNVTITATTTIQNYTSASSTPTTITSDQLSVGEQVFVIGTTTDDGSILARSVRTGTLPTFTQHAHNGNVQTQEPSQ